MQIPKRPPGLCRWPGSPRHGLPLGQKQVQPPQAVHAPRKRIKMVAEDQHLGVQVGPYARLFPKLRPLDLYTWGLGCLGGQNLNVVARRVPGPRGQVDPQGAR